MNRALPSLNLVGSRGVGRAADTLCRGTSEGRTTFRIWVQVDRSDTELSWEYFEGEERQVCGRNKGDRTGCR